MTHDVVARSPHGVPMQSPHKVLSRAAEDTGVEPPRGKAILEWFPRNVFPAPAWPSYLRFAFPDVEIVVGQHPGPLGRPLADFGLIFMRGADEVPTWWNERTGWHGRIFWQWQFRITSAPGYLRADQPTADLYDAYSGLQSLRPPIGEPVSWTLDAHLTLSGHPLLAGISELRFAGWPPIMPPTGIGVPVYTPTSGNRIGSLMVHPFGWPPPFEDEAVAVLAASTSGQVSNTGGYMPAVELAVGDASWRRFLVNLYEAAVV